MTGGSAPAQGAVMIALIAAGVIGCAVAVVHSILVHSLLTQP